MFGWFVVGERFVEFVLWYGECVVVILDDELEVLFFECVMIKIVVV